MVAVISMNQVENNGQYFRNRDSVVSRMSLKTPNLLQNKIVILHDTKTSKKEDEITKTSTRCMLEYACK